jgi:vacuolar-type H+-ATPase subunit E/Vma4
MTRNTRENNLANWIRMLKKRSSKIPEDPKTKKSLLLGFQELVKKQLKEGIVKEWGAFAGEMTGYIITEGKAVGLHAITAGWVPFVKFTTKEIMTIDEVNKATKALPA